MALIPTKLRGLNLLRALVRSFYGVVLFFGAAAFFNPVLCLFYPVRTKMGPLIMQLVSRAFLKVADVRVNRAGGRVPCNGFPLLILANHVSYLDILILSAVFRAVFVSKKEVFSWPIVGLFGRLSGIIYLDRQRMGSRIGLVKHLGATLTPAAATVVFPQGTTSSRVENRPFSKGIFKVVELNPEIRILPVTLDYEKEHQVVWKNKPFLIHALELLAIPSIRVRLIVHRTVTAADYAGQSVRKVAVLAEDLVKRPLIQEISVP